MTDDLTLRLLVVVVLLVGIAATRAWWQWHHHRVRHEEVDHPALPAELLGGGTTWVVFTTPWCATCGPTTDLLRRSDPDAHVVTIDVTDRPDLARDFSVRSAPTVLRTDEVGAVTRRLVGAAAVRDALSQPAQTGS
jgi:hypothetical protein